MPFSDGISHRFSLGAAAVSPQPATTSGNAAGFSVGGTVGGNVEAHVPVVGIVVLLLLAGLVIIERTFA